MNHDQQTARINVDEEEWIQFRTLAMRRRQSLADYLGELVREVIGDSSSPRQPERREAGAATRAPAAGPSPRSVRLSEQSLLTELPSPEPKPPAWEE